MNIGSKQRVAASAIEGVKTPNEVYWAKVEVPGIKRGSLKWTSGVILLPNAMPRRSTYDSRTTEIEISGPI